MFGTASGFGTTARKKTFDDRTWVLDWAILLQLNNVEEEKEGSRRTLYTRCQDIRDSTNHGIVGIVLRYLKSIHMQRHRRTFELLKTESGLK
jgi:hypothetical protein